MTNKQFQALDECMRGYMTDSAHDVSHVYRVLYAALDIAETEPRVDLDILITACLLHDIGRERQYVDPSLCHARVGGDMAYECLLARGWSEDRASHVRSCIASHRYRSDSAPESVEAKILFDADKLDATGAMGIARTLQYEARVNEPLYIVSGGEIVIDGGGGDVSSFFREYNFKLKKVYDGFFTDRARLIAVGRRKTAEDFYSGLHSEVMENARGADALSGLLDE